MVCRTVPGRAHGGGLRAGTLAVALVCLLAGAARADVSFERASSVGGGSRTETFDHTVGTGENRYLIVAVAVTPNSVPVDSITYGGQALRSIGQRGATVCRTELWGLVAPASGTHTITIKMGNDPSDLAAGAISLTGVNQSDPGERFASHTGMDNAPVSLETSVAVSAGDYTVDVVCGNGGAAPSTKAGPGQTERWGRSQGTLGAAGSTQPNGSSGRANMAWTLDGAGAIDWTIATAALKPAPVPPPPPPPPDAGPDVAMDVAPMSDVGEDVAPMLDVGEDALLPPDAGVEAIASGDAVPDLARPDLAPVLEDAAERDDAASPAPVHDVHLHVGCACRTGGGTDGGGWLLLLALAAISAGRRCSAARPPRRPATRRR